MMKKIVVLGVDTVLAASTVIKILILLRSLHSTAFVKRI